ncbi:Serine/Threonine kinase domain protein (macronuclear) [Tetrahymena thermophila SB210]|uniref:Serine/Threonine kinase domain protein n=1 Tax=Tetrahymena thermophila (strain SB210) TaxID=312017 RepID=Q22YT7_TETTS|nr:Serine/Threonine kinase domain protein [Tetrahymena thermophila SB210]EAR90584.2 Serine/Threonine kinase domain protein [Tetrahymena thermophila SB210]|eukprot:XP_001010829.2 Serine/Threonine kinase domain protein [Tetrahymena thermophila SB210]
MHRYKINMTLGYHQYGSYYRAESLENGEMHLIEEHNKKCSTWEECISIRQVKVLRVLNHPNIIKIKEIIRQDKQLFLVFEYFETNLSQYYQSFADSRKKISEEQIKKIIYQIALALNQCHLNGIMHRDLSPENIYVTKQNRIKVGQFSNAEFQNKHNNTAYVTSRYYESPESILKQQQNTKIDIWALGCIMGELYCLNPLFAGNSEIDQLMQILKIIGIPNHKEYPEFHTLCQQKQIKILPSHESMKLPSIIPQASSEAIDLLFKMLNINPSKRISIQAVLQHPFFSEINQKKLDQSLQKQQQYLQNQSDNKSRNSFSSQSKKQSSRIQLPYNSQTNTDDNFNIEQQQKTKSQQSSTSNSFSLIPAVSAPQKTQESSQSSLQNEQDSPTNNHGKRLSKFGMLSLPKLSDLVPISSFSQYSQKSRNSHENIKNSQQSQSDCQSDDSNENNDKFIKDFEDIKLAK